MTYHVRVHPECYVCCSSHSNTSVINYIIRRYSLLICDFYGKLFQKSIWIITFIRIFTFSFISDFFSINMKWWIRLSSKVSSFFFICVSHNISINMLINYIHDLSSLFRLRVINVLEFLVYHLHECNAESDSRVHLNSNVVFFAVCPMSKSIHLRTYELYNIVS